MMPELKTMRCVIVVLAMLAATAATAQNGSPCNEGRDRYQEPRSPYAICLPQVGSMNQPHEFLMHLAAVGDVDNSGTIDFVADNSARELLLYKGVMGGFPSTVDGYRIGPTERNSMTDFLAAGDWDSDGHPDIAVAFTYRVIPVPVTRKDTRSLGL